MHMKNGWQFVHDKMSAFATPETLEAAERLSKAKSILKEHGNYSWLTEHGSLVMSNNGVELVAAYTVMRSPLTVQYEIFSFKSLFAVNAVLKKDGQKTQK